jgi:flagellar basal-body rod modification protein FlgD
MALIQAVKDGKLVDTSAEASSQSSKKTRKEANNGLDKDAFLQLLVAQMKYQDPLQPTDNTEYISQLATFTQLEETQNMQNTLKQTQANDLVGKQVILKVTSAVTGEVNYVSGQVDYVLHENGETYLSVENKLYSIDDLDTVADSDYMDAVALSQSFTAAMAAMPSKSQLTLADETKLKNLRKAVEAMTPYQQKFLNEEALKKLAELEERMKELKKMAGITDSTEGSDDKDQTENEGESTEGDTTK